MDGTKVWNFSTAVQSNFIVLNTISQLATRSLEFWPAVVLVLLFAAPKCLLLFAGVGPCLLFVVAPAAAAVGHATAS